jgi:hypothetical protein
MNSLPFLIEGIKRVATLRKGLDAVLILLSWGRCTYPSMGLDSDLRVWGWATRGDRWLQDESLLLWHRQVSILRFRAG